MTTASKPVRRRGRIARVAGAALAGAVVALAGCRGDRTDARPRQFFPDMDDQPKWMPQSETRFFADGRTMRPPVEGTVPFGYSPIISDEAWAEPLMLARADLAELDRELATGRGEDGQFLQTMPIPVTAEVIERGRDRFNIYCTPCHGYLGDGRGLVGQRFAVQPADLRDPKYMDPAQEFSRDGYIFDVIQNGLVTRVEGAPDQVRMPAYGHALSERDTWAVIAYVRVLQEAQSATLDDVPPEQRAVLEASRPEPPPPVDAGAEGAAAGQPGPDAPEAGATEGGQP